MALTDCQPYRSSTQKQENRPTEEQADAWHSLY